MQNFSSLISPAQAALNNAKTQNYGSLQSPNIQYSSMASFAPTSQPMATSTVTGKPVAGSITGTPNPVHTAITQIANNANKAILSHANTATPLGTASNSPTGVQSDPLMSAPAHTPQQIAASQGMIQTGGGTDGMAPQYGAAPATGSTGATFPGLVGGMLGTGTPAQMAANQTPSGLLGNNIGQTQGILQNQQGMITPFIQQNLDTIKAATQQAEQLTGGSYSGTAADYSGRLAQLENIKQAAQGNINSASTNLGKFSGQASDALQSGLGAATQQVQAPYGTPLYNPLSGKTMDSAGAGASGIVSQWSDYLAKGGDPSQVPASVSGNSVLWGQVLNGAKASNPNFDVNTALGQASGRQTVGATGGAITSQQQTQVAQYKSALQQGQNLQSQLTDLITSFGLNPSDVNVVNAGLQKIAQNTSSPQYKMLQNYVNDVANTYAQVLTPPGGSATDTTRGIASSMLDATYAGQSLIAVMKGLDNAANAKIAGIPTTNTGTTGGSSGGTMFGSFFGK